MNHNKPPRIDCRITLVLLTLALSACARTPPAWTPEDVAPPASLEAALEAVDHARDRGATALPSIDAATQPLTRDGAIVTALARNRSLAVERFGPMIADTNIALARSEFDPAILATLSHGKSTRPSLNGDRVTSKEVSASVEISETLPTGTEVFLSGGLSRAWSTPGDTAYEGSWSLGVNQNLLRGFGADVNLVALRQARNTAAIRQHELRGFVLELVRQVDAAYWNLVLALETRKIREFSVELSHEQLLLNEDLIAVGKLAGDAILTTEAELASSRADLVDAAAAIRSRNIELIRLLNPEDAGQWAISFSPQDPPDAVLINLTPDTSAQLADLYRPELAQARLDLANRDLDVVRTRNGLMPLLTAFASYGRLSGGDSTSGAFSHLDDTRYDNYQAGLSFSMSPFNRAEEARHAIAGYQRQQSEAAVANLSQLIETEVRLAIVEVQRQWERIAATRSEVRSREEEYDVERDRFRVGKSTNLDVLQVQRDLVQARLDEITARVRYVQAITALYYAEGTLLDRRGVAVNAPEENPQ